MAISAGGGSVNTMVLGGLALAFSRLIDNSVVVLENIFRHLEMGEPPEVAAEKGGQEVALAVLAATLTTAIVFFPVVFLYGVSRFLFVALAMAVVLSLLASYVVAMTVVPLFCAKLDQKTSGRRRGRARLNRRPLRRDCQEVQHLLRENAGEVRPITEQRASPAGRNRSRVGRRFLTLSLDVSVAGSGVFPAHGSRSICH